MDFFLVRLVVGARRRNLFLSKHLIFGVSFAQLFKRRHVSHIRKFAGRRRGRDRAQKPAAAALATSATRAGHVVVGAGSGMMRARPMGSAHKISAAAGERKAHPAAAETEPTSGYYPNHTPPA
jgi:hypothetical protein